MHPQAAALKELLDKPELQVMPGCGDAPPKRHRLSQCRAAGAQYLTAWADARNRADTDARTQSHFRTHLLNDARTHFRTHAYHRAQVRTPTLKHADLRAAVDTRAQTDPQILNRCRTRGSGTGTGFRNQPYSPTSKRLSTV